MSNWPSAPPPHDFEKSKELEKRHTGRVNEILRAVFPFVSEITPENDIDQDKRGVDKIVTCLFYESGKRMAVEILIDQKIRPFKDYGDCYLEEWSDEAGHKPGWLNRRKITDYILYYFAPTDRYMIVPFLILQAAFYHNYKTWKKEYRTLPARNKGYVTTGLAIPCDVLFEALKKEMMGGTRIGEGVPLENVEGKKP